MRRGARRRRALPGGAGTRAEGRGVAAAGANSTGPRRASNVEARRPKRDESQGADLVGITGCFCALAETGTLVLTSSGETPSSTHLLPETHVAIVPASRIVARHGGRVRADASGARRRRRHDAARDQHGVRALADRRHRTDHRAGSARPVPGAHHHCSSRLTTRSGARETASCRNGDGQPSESRCPPHPRWRWLRAAAFAGPTIAGVPVEFILFAATLAGVALFHRHTMPIAVGGATIVAIYKIAVFPVPRRGGLHRILRPSGPRVGGAREPLHAAAGLRPARALLRGKPGAGHPAPATFRTTGRAASCCSCSSSCCRASSTTSPPR